MSWTEDIPTWQLVLLSLVGYVYLCRILRYRRLHQKEALYPYKTREDYAKMTAQHAYEIQRYLFSIEFPFTTRKALEFALFRTYGIPTISKLLNSTQQLSDKEFASRRFADTTVLISEMMGWSPEAERTNAAIARTNYLHSPYQKKGLISNDDMLYTLALFTTEPVNWVKRYEWREMTEMEICAMGTFWKSIGDAMKISYDPLPSSAQGWRSGLEWYNEIQTWSITYEKRVMLPSPHNKKTADETTAILLYDVPPSLLKTGRAIVSALMDTRLRNAMMYPEPPKPLTLAITTTFYLRKQFLRYLALPRPYFLRHSLLCEKANKFGRYHRVEYDSEPWYMEPTLRNRWGVQAWLKWAGGKPIPGGALYKPQGYLIEEVGPKAQEKRGLKEFEEGKEELMRAGRGGCPFSVGGK